MHSQYKPEYCQMIIDMMSTGDSVTQVANKFGVPRRYLYMWEEDSSIPEWKDAFEFAREASEAFWESRLKEVGLDETLKSTAPVKTLEFIMASRFRENYGRSSTTRQEIEIKHIASMSDADLDAQIQRLLPPAQQHYMDIDPLSITDGEIVEE